MQGQQSSIDSERIETAQKMYSLLYLPTSVIDLEITFAAARFAMI